MKKNICIHGHFYQPPRENPWLEEVEMQDSAQPFHDWNERITSQCYGPNASSRILDDERRIIRIVNNYSRISFNFGPTLLSWLQRHQPEIYEGILEADRKSMERFNGHGSALAQVYNHMIMPLANERDKRTQVTWGLEDFQSRFGRDPAGMWLPETAVDHPTLEVLVDHGIKFTILAPRQGSRIRRIKPDQGQWRNVSGDRIDPTTPYICQLPSGREITLFFYDGPLSQDLAFGDLLQSGIGFKDRLMSLFTDNGRDWPQLVHVATDGETFGHHHRFGDMALAYCLHLIEEEEGMELVNYADFLEQNPPLFEVEIFENSSWSCVHGVERWKSDCGCSSGGNPGWDQKWREPLRNSLNWLRDTAARIFEEQGKDLFPEPWKARDAYIQIILNRDHDNLQSFLHNHAPGAQTPQQTVNALKFLEMQRFAQLIFTSCAWFFDEISGIETVQILQYAARTLQLAEDLTGDFLEADFLEKLREAPSNVLENGAQVFENHVKPARVDLLQVGAHIALSSIFEEYPDEFELGAYRTVFEIFNHKEAGRAKLGTGKARIYSVITHEEILIGFAAVYMGEHNVTCGVRHFDDMETYRALEKDLQSTFDRGDVVQMVRSLDKYFGENTYSTYHLFRDEQRKVVSEILEPIYREANASYRQIYESNYPILNFLKWLNIPFPRELKDATENVLGTDLSRLFSDPEMDTEALGKIIGQIQRFSLNLDDESLGFKASGWINHRMEHLQENPNNLDLLKKITESIRPIRALSLNLDLWRSENIYFNLAHNTAPEIEEKARQDDDWAREWIDVFEKLGELLRIKIQ